MNEDALAHWGLLRQKGGGEEKKKKEEVWYEALHSVWGCRKIYCYKRSQGVPARPVKGRALGKEKLNARHPDVLLMTIKT